MRLDITKTKQTRIWIGQPLHFACLVVLLIPVYFAWESLGESFPTVFWGAVAAPVAHQVYVWLAWRLEIQNQATSKTIGFRAYVVIFFVLFASRFVSLLTLAWVDRGSMNLDVIPVTILTVILALPGIYAIYSVKRYFGMARAAGADHFDSRYRSMPLVNKGIFRFTSNGMYLYAFLLFWAIAIAFNSTLALTVAAFSHVYIWVHFYATEKPDMEYLYHADHNHMQSDAAKPRRCTSLFGVKGTDENFGRKTFPLPFRSGIIDPQQRAELSKKVVSWNPFYPNGPSLPSDPFI